jgi:hypothetical protein
MVLLDHLGNPLIGQHLSDGDSIQVGSSLSIVQYWVRVLSVLPLPAPDAMASKVRVPDREPVHASASRSEISMGNHCKQWKITYSTCKDLARGRMKAYDGSIELS